SDPSWRPESFMGRLTRRPSVVIATATWRRFRPWNRPNVVSRTLPGGPGRFAQSTRRFVIAQPSGLHAIATAGRAESGRRSGTAGSRRDLRRRGRRRCSRLGGATHARENGDREAKADQDVPDAEHVRKWEPR